MYIQPNMLLTPTEKLIKPYECSFIVIEGPNMKGKLNLEGLEIKYESFYLSQLVLNTSAQDQPALYGFLGNNVTFLMVRAKYMPTDPNWAVETDQYIEYYFADDPTQVRKMGQLMVLTGNSTNRIPQIYFNNPQSTYKVYLEVLMANLAQDSLTNTNQYTQDSYFNGLYYNSIVSDVVNYIIPTSTGSTELIVLDMNNIPVTVIPYNNIRTITKLNPTTLLIGLDTEEKIKLEFLSEFNCDQANSRINWVLKNQRGYVLTKTSPSIDTTPPIINLNTGLLTGYTSGITSGTTLVYYYTLTTGQTLSTVNLIDYFISSVTDNRDGTISKYDTQLTIYPLNDYVPVTGISSAGIYNILFSARDLANNWSTIQVYMYITGVAPSIIFKPAYTGSTITLALNDYSRNCLSGTTIRAITVNSVYDEIDTGLSIYDIIMANYGQTGFTFETVGITTGLTYTLTNNAGLTTVITKNMIVVLPEIIFKNTGSTFDISLSSYPSEYIFATDIRDYTVKEVKDYLDNTITISNNVQVNVVGVPTGSPISTIGLYTVNYVIYDSYSSHNTYIKYMNVTS